MIKFAVDYNSEMLAIFNANGKCLFSGNFWDFDRPHDILNLFDELGIEYKLDENADMSDGCYKENDGFIDAEDV